MIEQAHHRFAEIEVKLDALQAEEARWKAVHADLTDPLTRSCALPGRDGADAVRKVEEAIARIETGCQDRIPKSRWDSLQRAGFTWETVAPLPLPAAARRLGAGARRNAGPSEAKPLELA